MDLWGTEAYETKVTHPLQARTHYQILLPAVEPKGS